MRDVSGEKAVAMKEQATEMRMSVPIGSITAATVDGQSSSRAAAAAAAKKQGSGTGFFLVSFFCVFLFAKTKFCRYHAVS